MATRTIYVSRHGAGSHNLRLRDSEGNNPGDDNLTTSVDSGDTVQWVLDPNSNTPQSGYFPIASIVSIAYSAPTAGPPPKYKNSIRLIVPDPTNNNPAKIWSGNVLNPAPAGFEDYTIGFTVPNDSVTYYDDPKMILNP